MFPPHTLAFCFHLLRHRPLLQRTPTCHHFAGSRFFDIELQLNRRLLKFTVTAVHLPSITACLVASPLSALPCSFRRCGFSMRSEKAPTFKSKRACSPLVPLLLVESGWPLRMEPYLPPPRWIWTVWTLFWICSFFPFLFLFLSSGVFHAG